MANALEQALAHDVPTALGMAAGRRANTWGDAPKPGRPRRVLRL